MSDHPPPSPQQNLVDDLLGRPGPEIDYEAHLEDLGVMADNRLNELPAARQDQLVRLVARDPVAAQMLDDAVQINRVARALEAQEAQEAQESQAADPAPPPAAEPAPRLVFPIYTQMLRAGFALAAGLTLAVGVWRFVEPPINRPATPTGQVQPFHTHGSDPGPDYWGQHRQQEREDRVRRDTLRDYGLIGLGGLSLGLGLALLLRQRRPPAA